MPHQCGVQVVPIRLQLGDRLELVSGLAPRTDVRSALCEVARVVALPVLARTVQFEGPVTELPHGLE